MCGILGVVATSPVNQLLYDGLMVLQHRGQDAAGIATAEGNTFNLHKGPGLVQCLQLHGGYGYMWEYPIARAWADARVARIYGGSNEIMKELIARQLP